MKELLKDCIKLIVFAIIVLILALWLSDAKIDL